MNTIKLKVNITILLMLCITSVSAQWSHFVGTRSRTINSVKVLDVNHIVMVGGIENNDPIQYILQTNNGGQDWNMVIDSISSSSWLTSVDFINGVKGFAVGKKGKILKTTNSGNTWSVVQAPTNRDLNSVFNVDANISFIVGGNKENDSIQTILKTTDGGTNWSVIRDVQGYWLKSVFFINSNVGFVVGEHGVVLKTINGGLSWISVNLPTSVSTRTYNSIYFTDDLHGVIVGGEEGGWQTNDSIQTILKTDDGGTTWNIIRDNPNPCLRSVTFSDNNTGFAAGNNGTLLKSFNGGLNWEQIVLPDNTIENNFYTVDFLTSFYGFVAGKNGIIYRFQSDEFSSPYAETCEVSFEGNDVIFSAKVRGNNAPSSVTFQYGLDLDYTFEVNAEPTTILDTGLQSVSARISGLSMEHVYNYRVKVVSNVGTVTGVNKTFYFGENPIPNWDFENWNSDTVPIPVSWMAVLGNVSKELSYDGSWCVMLKSDSIEQSTGALLLSMIDDNPMSGGIPFTYRPDSIICWMNYSIPQSDTAFVLIALKSQGATISQKFFPITGSTSSQFIEQKFWIEYENGNIPDTIILGFTNSNPFDDQNIYTNDGFLAVDNIRFNNPVPSLPNFDFEDWSYFISTRPVGWFVEERNFNYQGFYNTTSESADRFLHSKAVLISNNVDGVKKIKGEITTNRIKEDSWNKPSFPINAKYQFLTGYYKFEPENSDTAFINVRFFKEGNVIATGECVFSEINDTYSPFIIQILYQDPNQSISPDSASIIVQSYKEEVYGNSKLWLDALSFDGFISNTIKSEIFKTWNSNIYPNPFSEFITIESSIFKDDYINMRIFNISGKLFFNSSVYFSGKYILNTSFLPQGLYFIEITNNKERQIKKMIKF